ncbi:hypothetical protein FNW02_30530 [Komarekiella sp. 'clone 1']|uniref:Uncharacterized protein n=2 Tax=Komarekiella TaxID=2022127 RepID=A0AA40T324_9NOST|nr:hypothetical protein [Komarekiella delphini-convector SJRDD-AB1]
MQVIVEVIEKVARQTPVEVPDGLERDAIKQYLVDKYNAGELDDDFEICGVEFESISARIIQYQGENV